MPNYFKQQINKWLCLIFIGVLLFWIAVYYLKGIAEVAGMKQPPIELYLSS